jgi:2-desacetyl-2-hydroxyethyl bacteriochlorophyllide A dehydrogenase
LVLGHELAGVVEHVHGAVGAFAPGEQVAVYPLSGCDQCRYCANGQDYICRRRRVLGLHVAGGFAEYLKVPAKNLYRLPREMGSVRGSLVEPLANALHFVGAAEQDRGPVAILGAGPIGILILQVAKQLAFTKIAVVEVNPIRSAVAKKLGADLTVNPKETEALNQLEDFFGEDGCNAVFDAVGFSPTRQLALRLVRSGGLIVLVGLGEAETSLDFVEVIRREVRIVGTYAYSRREFQEAIQWVVSGRVTLEGWISEAPLAEGQSVFEDLVRPDSTRIKVILKP